MSFGVFCSLFACLPVAFICGCLVDASSLVYCIVFVCVHARVCTHMHNGIITSCLSWLEIVSLIPLHHMSGFICVLCQELMEFLHGSLWKSLKTPDLMWCVNSRQHSCLWLICCLFICSLVVFVSLYFVIFSLILNEFLDEISCQFFCVYVSGSSFTHHCIHQKQHRCFLFATFFSLQMKWKGNGIVF